MKRYVPVLLMVAMAGCGSSATNTTDGSSCKMAQATCQATPECCMGLTCTNGVCAADSSEDMAGGGPDMAVPPPSGTKLAAGTFTISGVTTDNLVIAFDPNKPSTLVYASVDKPGKANTLDAVGASYSIRGQVVLLWENSDQLGFGSANAWTLKSGLVPLPNGMASVAGVAAATDDGKYIMWAGNALPDTTAYDLFVGGADGSGAKKFATQVTQPADGVTDGCSSFGNFSKLNVLIVKACGVTGGGAAHNELWAVDPATGTPTVLDANSGDLGFIIDPTGQQVAASDPQGNWSFFPVAGGKAVPFDADIKDGVFLPDGSAFVYLTNGGALKRASTGGAPNPTVLVASNVTQIQTPFVSAPIQSRLSPLSPDGKWIVISNQKEMPDTLFPSDLFVASTSTPGTPKTLVPDVTGALFGDPFTGDSKYVQYIAGVFRSGAGFVGALTVVPIDGSAAPVKVTSTEWVGYAGTGSILMYSDNYKGGGKGNGRGDIKLIDAAQPTSTPKKIATQAEADFLFTWDRKNIVYSQYTGTAAGIYAVPATLP